MTIVHRRLALAIGDPHGIGPEIALKALQQLSAAERSLIKVYGPWSALEQAAQICQMEPLLQDLIDEEAGSLAQPVQWGEITPQAGLSTVQSATAAIRACENGEVDAVIVSVQAPVMFWAGSSRCRGTPDRTARSGR